LADSDIGNIGAYRNISELVLPRHIGTEMLLIPMLLKKHLYATDGQA